MPKTLSPLTCLLAAFLGFALTAIIEFILIASSVPLFEPGAGAGLTVLAHIIGLSGVAALAFGLGAALVLPPLVASLQPRKWWTEHVWPARETLPEVLVGTTAGAVGVGVGAGVVAAAAGLAGRAAHGFMNPSLVLPFVALGALAGLAAGFFAFFPARQGSRWLLEHVARRGRLLGLPAPAWIVLAIAAAGGLGLYLLSQLELGAYQPGGLQILAVSTVITLLLLMFWRDRSPLRLGMPALIMLLGIWGCGAWAVVGFADAPISQRAILLEGHLSRLVVARLRLVFDGDGDGYSALLMGGDCDDNNAAVGPQAHEIPGNGIDDNCAGGDAPLEDVADLPAQPKVAVASNAAPGSDGAAPATEAAPPPPKPRHNVLLIFVDTLRPDHLGLYGYPKATSPNVDAWSKNAVIFDQARSQAPNTPRSVPSFLVGRYPSRLKWVERRANYGSLKPENETLFEIFQKGGWRTEVVSSHWYFERAEGIKDGVDLWDNDGFLTIKESNTQVAAHLLTPRVVSRLETLSTEAKPFFLMVHYFEPHGRYVVQPTATKFGSELVDKYNSEISYVDLHLAPLFAALDRLDLYKNTIVVLISDHGEAFKEHGFHFHGATVYEEEVRVPLIMRVPGVANRRVPDSTGLIDSVPSLTELVGLEAPAAQGRSFVPALTGEALPDRVLFMEQLPYPNYGTHIVAAVDSKGLKVVRNVTANVTEVFNLKADPLEKVNLLDHDPQAGEDLRQTLDRFIDADPG